MTKDFSITPEDYKNSGQLFISADDCPATVALARQFGLKASIFKKEVRAFPEDGIWGRACDLPLIGIIEDEWDPFKFRDLAQGKEFRTKITLNN